MLIGREGSESCSCPITCCVIQDGFAVTGFCIGVPIAIVGLIMGIERGNSTQTTTDSSYLTVGHEYNDTNSTIIH